MQWKVQWSLWVAVPAQHQRLGGAVEGAGAGGTAADSGVGGTVCDDVSRRLVKMLGAECPMWYPQKKTDEDEANGDDHSRRGDRCGGGMRGLISEVGQRS